MLVREMLQLPSFEGSNVITGSPGLDNEVTSAMILEGADIENWGRRGQVIITSYFALEHLSQHDIGRIFRVMSAIGIAALAFKPGRLVDEVPEHIVELCDDFDLPLVCLSPTVKYEAILSDVLGHVLDSNLTLLNRFYDVHKHVMTLALKQPSTPYILNTLKNTLHADVTFFDTVRDRRLGTNQERTGFTRYAFDRRDPERYQTHAYYDAHLVFCDEDAALEGQSPVSRGHSRGPAGHNTPTDPAIRDQSEHSLTGRQPDIGHAENALAVHIPSSDAIDYFLIIHNDGHDLTQLDIMTVENIVSLLQMEILKQNAIKQKLFYQHNNTVHDLLLGRFGSRERIDEACRLLGIDHHPLYEALLLRVSMTDNVDLDRLDDLQQSIRRRLRSLYPGIVYFVNGDRLVFLHNFPTLSAGIDIEEVERVLTEAHVNSSLPLFSHLAVLSGSTNRYRLPDINDEVVNTYRLFGESHHENRCVRFDDLGVYKLLLKAESLTRLNDYIDPRVIKLARSHPELLETLIALCRHNLNYAAAAKELYLHPKTVRYRVNRTRELCGIDLGSSDDYLQIVLATKILSLSGGISNHAAEA